MCQSRPHLERKRLQIRPWQRRKQHPQALLTSAPSCTAPQPPPKTASPRAVCGPGAWQSTQARCPEPARLDAAAQWKALAPEFGNTEPETPRSGNPCSRVGSQHSPVQAPPQARETGGQGLFLPTSRTPRPSLASQPPGSLTGDGRGWAGAGGGRRPRKAEEVLLGSDGSLGTPYGPHPGKELGRGRRRRLHGFSPYVSRP